MAIYTHVIFRPDDIKKKRRNFFVEQGTGITYLLCMLFTCPTQKLIPIERKKTTFILE